MSYDLLPTEKLMQLGQEIGGMQLHYGTTRVCPFRTNTTCDVPLEPGNSFDARSVPSGANTQFLFILDLTKIMQNSENPEELSYYWKEWYDKAGTPMRSTFNNYVKLKNEAAHLNSE